MKQTILGAGGAIGTALASELTAYTDDIRLVSRQPRPVNATDELLAADLLDAAATDRAVAGSEVVYLVAGLPYQARCWEQQWPLLMQHVLQSCQRHGARLVFFDNVYMYAPAATPHLTEQSPIGPTSRKGQVRARVADALLEAAAAGKVQALIARSAKGQALNPNLFVAGGSYDAAGYGRLAGGDAGGNADVAAILEAPTLEEAELASRRALDKAARNISISDSDGVGIILDFLRRKEMEVAKLRLIGRGKFYDLSAEQIRQEVGA